MTDTPQSKRLHLERSSSPRSEQEDAEAVDHTANGIPSVKPVVDNHDRLWAEVDVLDDAAEMAHQAKTNKSFFGPQHADALQQLRTAQAQLVQVMSTGEQHHDKEKYKKLWENSDIDSLRKNLFDQEQFENISEHVKNTRTQLNNVAKQMDALDQINK